MCVFIYLEIGEIILKLISGELVIFQEQKIASFHYDCQALGGEI